MPHAAHTSPRAWFLCVAQGPSPPVHATPSGHHGSETPHAAPTVSPAGCHPMAIRTQPPQWHQQFTTWTPDYVTGPAGEEDTRNGGAYALPAASPAGDGHGVRSPGAACPSATRHGWRGASSYSRTSGTVGWLWNSRLGKPGQACYVIGPLPNQAWEGSGLAQPVPRGLPSGPTIGRAPRRHRTRARFSRTTRPAPLCNPSHVHWPSAMDDLPWLRPRREA